MIYDESATSSTATVNSELLPDRSNKDGATSGSAVNIKVPINKNIPQAPESMQGYGVAVQGEYLAGERQYSGAELLRLAKENNVPVNRKLGAALRAGVPKAVEVMQKRLAERGVGLRVDVPVVQPAVKHRCGSSRSQPERSESRQ